MMDVLTDDQAAVYDRQLRVWGVEVQKRLTSTKILIVGSSGLAAEIAKNIVLAGVGAVTLMDTTPSSERSPGNFLVPADADPAISAARASARMLQEMNPLVSVVAEEHSVADIIADPALLRNFDIVVSVQPSMRAHVQLDGLAREAGAKFLAAGTAGPCSYLFANLGHHSYTFKNPKFGERTEEGEADYISMEAAMSAPLVAGRQAGSPMFGVLKACSHFEAQHGRMPGAADLEALQEVAAVVASQDGVAPEAVNRDFLEAFVCSGGELAPVAAVLGGVVGNEIVKIISHKNEPVNNFFFFTLFDGAGLIEDIRP